MKHDIELDDDQQQLLRDVKAGKVARHRRSRTGSPALGTDYQEAPGHGPGGMRKAGRRLQGLQARGLVRLPAANDHDRLWPWTTTVVGDAVLEHLAAGDTVTFREPGDPS